MNPSELTLLILRIGFLALLWLFVFAVVYALRSDLFGQRVRRMPVNSVPATPFATVPARPATPPAPSTAATAPTAITQVPASSSPSTSATGSGTTRLVIISGDKEGVELPLSNEPLTIGRSNDSGLVIRDDYTSTHHARLMLWDNVWMIQDLDSTNGTFLDGSRVSIPTPVPLNTPVRIGATSFELRR